MFSFKILDNQATDINHSIHVNFSLITDQINNWISGSISLLPNLIVAIILFISFVFLAKFIKQFVIKRSIIHNRSSLGEVLGGLLKWSIIVLGFLLSATIVLPTLNPGDLVAGLGIGSVAIGFAFKDILQNWLAGLLILLRQPFSIGDAIKVNSYEGNVERVETRATIIKTFDGQRIVIPNSEIYTSAILVKTAYAIRRSEYDVGIGYGDSIENATKIIHDVLAHNKAVETQPSADVRTVDLAASWVTLRVRWWVDSTKNDIYKTQSEVLTAIKIAFDQHGIDMPYETQVNLLHNQTEDVDGIRGQQREGWPKPQELN
jgi:small conductance mechanosensitive channel